MFGWLKRGPAKPDTALAMIGARTRDEVLFLGTKDLSLAAETGAVTKLNGRTVLVGQGTDARPAVERAAEKAGAILEYVDAPFATLPFGRETFHIAVVPVVAAWWTQYVTTLAEAARVLRPGGRIILILGEPSRGVFRRSNDRAALPATDAVLALLTATGFIAARKLAEADGVTYYEARKTRN